MSQQNSSLWIRPRNAKLSHEINSYSLARLNEKYSLQSKNKAEAARRILYDSGFSYDGVLPTGAQHGDPQFSGFYDNNSTLTAYRIAMDWLERDVKAHGYDCTGRRETSLYLQALAGNKTAKKSLDALYGDCFPAHPRDAWLAIEQIIHRVYADYLKQYGCPNRLCAYPMYPTTSPPLPNPVKLRSRILRARKARDFATLSWMLGRTLKPEEFLVDHSERLVMNILHLFGYTSIEVIAMRSILCQAENIGQSKTEKSDNKKPGRIMSGYLGLLASLAFVYGILSLSAQIMKDFGRTGVVTGIVLLLGVLGFLIALSRQFRGRKGRPP